MLMKNDFTKPMVVLDILNSTGCFFSLDSVWEFVLQGMNFRKISFSPLTTIFLITNRQYLL